MESCLVPYITKGFYDAITRFNAPCNEKHMTIILTITRSKNNCIINFYSHRIEIFQTHAINTYHAEILQCRVYESDITCRNYFSSIAQVAKVSDY